MDSNNGEGVTDECAMKNKESIQNCNAAEATEATEEQFSDDSESESITSISDQSFSRGSSAFELNDSTEIPIVIDQAIYKECTQQIDIKNAALASWKKDYEHLKREYDQLMVTYEEIKAAIKNQPKTTRKSLLN